MPRDRLKKSVPKKLQAPLRGPEKQFDLFAKNSKSYGGTLLRTRRGRRHARPLSTTQSMHLVLRSSQAQGEQSFKHPRHAKDIQRILQHFSKKYGIVIQSLANVGNHLHFQLKITRRQGYYRFIRAITSAIAMRVTGRNRWTAHHLNRENKKSQKFWDYRPFTRILNGLRDFLTVRDYIHINQLEGLGTPRAKAHFLLRRKHPLVC